MDTNARVGTAVAAGYLFGRFKKLRLALLVGTALASEDVRKSAVGLVTHGTSGLASGGAGRLAGNAGSRLIDAGRGVAVSAAASRLERLSDRLAERTESLGGTPSAPGDRSDDEPDDSAEYDQDDQDEYDEDGYDDVQDEGESEEPEDVDDEPAEPAADEDEYDDEPEEPAAPVRARRTRARRTRALAPAGGR
jgi:hypothetical protein